MANAQPGGAATRHVVVLGAGVIGLQTAILLLKQGYGGVTVVAKHFPGDESVEYTSPWAGAQWRTHATADQEEQCDWDMQSYRAWMHAVDEDREGAARIGIMRFPSLYYSAGDTTKESVEKPWFAEHTTPFAVLSREDIPVSFSTGHKYPSIAINVPKYLKHLHSTALELGAIMHRVTLPTPLSTALRELPHLIPSCPSPLSLVVNATGIGAKGLVPDASVFPIRGQTLLIRFAQDVPALSTAEDRSNPARPEIMYILPRGYPGSPDAKVAVVGGTKDKDDWRAEPDAKITREILERGRRMWPEGFGRESEYEILEQRVGLRPGRTGGARVEVENGLCEGVTVVHSYGHAGAGFQNALGSARKVVDLANGWFERH